MKHLKSVILGIFAGMAISFGGLINLICISQGHRLLGNILFGVGLLIVCSFGLFLFTGKIGYVFDNKKDYLLTLLEMYVGNLLGALAIGYGLRLANSGGLDLAIETAETIASKKLVLDPGGSSWYGMLINGFLCGILVYLAVDAFKNELFHPVLRIFILLLCVATFVIAGFEHCIANMFYFGFSNTYASAFGDTVLSLFICTVGNSLGTIALNEGLKFAKNKIITKV